MQYIKYSERLPFTHGTSDPKAKLAPKGPDKILTLGTGQNLSGTWAGNIDRGQRLFSK